MKIKQELKRYGWCNMIKKLQTKAGRLFTALPIFLLMMSLGISLAVAGALDQPKADGMIGEQADGYLGLVRQDVPPDIKALVRDVNAKRKARYQTIAGKQSVPLSEVEKVGGTTAIDKTLRGNYIKDSSGRWRKK
jgi:uncharacterized protein YdbL (DUF1318 family)